MRPFVFKRLRAMLAAPLILALAAACAPAAAPSQTTAPGPSSGTTPTDGAVAFSDRTFIKTYLIIPGDIDPHGQFYNIGSETVVRTFYESLVDYSPKTGKLEGVLASEWEASDDARTYTFKLREGVKFHDGSALNAEAVKLSFERIVELGFVRAGLLRFLDNVEVVDELTVRVNMKQADAAFLANAQDLPIVSGEAIKSQPKEWFLTHEAGSGAYQLDQPAYDPNATVVKYAPFQDYWRGWGPEGFVTTIPAGAKRIGKIEMHQVPESATQRLMLERGEAHFMAGFPIAYLTELQGHPEVAPVTLDAFRISLLPLNVSHGPLADVRLREMLKLAFPYEAYVNDYYKGNAEPAAGPVNPKLLDDPSLTPATQDLERAKALLGEAGFAPGELKLTYAAPTGQEEQMQPAILLQDALAQIGVELEIKTMPFTEIARLTASGPENTPDIMTLINTPKGIDPGVGMLETFFHSKNAGGPSNWGHYKNPKVDELLDQARATIDDSRNDLLREAQQTIVSDVGALFLAFPDKWSALSTDIGGYWLSPIGIDRDPWYDMYWTQ